MSDDADSVAPDEAILRRIPIADGHFNPQKIPPVERGSFTPNKKDTDGISCYLERLMSVEALIEASLPRPASKIVIVRLQASVFFDLGLTLRRTFDPGDLPGHSIVPELNWNDYQSKKKMLTPAIVQLMLLAQDNVAFNGSLLEDC
jgi:hypothetical protein